MIVVGGGRRMRTIFVFLPEEHNHSMATAEFENTLGLMLGRREIPHSTQSFWDDAAGYAKYGVRLDINAPLDDDAFLRQLGGIVYIASLQYGSIEIQLDRNCITT
jgi:hypothetical protein